MTDVNEKITTALEGFNTFKSELAPRLDKLDSLDLAQIEKMEKAMGDAIDFAQKQEAKNKHLEEKQALLETALSRPAPAADSVEQKDKQAANEAKGLFNKFLRKGSGAGRGDEDFGDFMARQSFSDDETKSLVTKAMTVNSDPDGGYLVEPEFGGMIQTKVYETSPMRQLANVMTIGTNSLEYILDNDEAEANWVGETEPRPVTDTPQLAKLDIVANEIYAQPKASQRFLDDAGINVEAWLADKVAQAFSRKENTAFMVGDGVNKPRGLLTYTAGTTIASQQIEQINSGGAAAFTYDGLVNLQSALKEAYQANASFLVNRKGFGSLLLLKDLNGSPIFNMAYDTRVGLQRTILGSPLYFASDMAEVGSNALAAAYGDFKRAYTIVDRTGVRVLRDPYTDKPFVKFYTTKRVGGSVVNFEAVKIQKIAS